MVVSKRVRAQQHVARKVAMAIRRIKKHEAGALKKIAAKHRMHIRRLNKARAGGWFSKLKEKAKSKIKTGWNVVKQHASSGYHAAKQKVKNHSAEYVKAAKQEASRVKDRLKNAAAEKAMELAMPVVGNVMAKFDAAKTKISNSVKHAHDHYTKHMNKLGLGGAMFVR